MKSPLLSFYLFGVNFYVWRDFEVSIEPLETRPYAPDGSIPLIFLRLGFFEVNFESKYFYKKLYISKYEYEPEGLE